LGGRLLHSITTEIGESELQLLPTSAPKSLQRKDKVITVESMILTFVKQRASRTPTFNQTASFALVGLQQ